MIKTIIFDLGNVIINVDNAKLFKELAAKSSKTASYTEKWFENSSCRKGFGNGKLTARQFYDKTAQELNLKINFNEFSKIWCDIFTLNEDVEKLIRDLKGKYRLLLLSNTDILHFDYIKNKYKIIDIFDDYVLSYKVGYSKPNPLIFLSALKKAKALPFNCAYIDDIPEFVYVARLMGIRAFQYKNFGKLANDLKRVKVYQKLYK